MFEQAFKNIDDILRKDAGVGSELDYIEQTSWVLFLKYLDDLERTKEKEARLAGRQYKDIIDPKYKWEAWAAPKTPEGKLDHNKALSGDDLIDFVERELFESYLQNIFANPGRDWEVKKLFEVCEIGDGNHSSNYPKASEMLSLGVYLLLEESI